MREKKTIERIRSTNIDLVAAQRGRYVVNQGGLVTDRQHTKIKTEFTKC